MKLKYTEEQVKTAVANSRCYSDVFRELGILINGGSYSWLKRTIARFGLDTSHFIDPKIIFAQRREAYQQQNKVKPLFEITSTQRVRASLLRGLLLRNGFEKRCGKCGLIDWNGFPITLDIDHKDNNCLNNHVSNLGFLCPNCHRQKTQMVAEPRIEREA